MMQDINTGGNQYCGEGGGGVERVHDSGPFSLTVLRIFSRILIGQKIYIIFEN